MRRLLLGLGLLLFFVASAHSATYFVQASCSGCDANSCNAATNINTPKQTIANTINNCWRNPGDIIDVRGGVYAEMLHYSINVNWPTGGGNWANAMIIRGHAGETAILRPNSNADNNPFVVDDRTSYIVFDNLTFDAINIQGAGQNLKLDGDHIRVQNCVIKNHQQGNGIQGGGPGAEFLNNEIFGNRGYGHYTSGDDNLFDGNYIHNNNGYGIHIYESSLDCPSFNCNNNNIVRNNIIMNNGGSNPNPAGSCGLLSSGGNNNQYYNNVVTGQDGCGMQVYGYNTSNTRVFNNTLVGNGGQCVRIEDPGGAPATGTVVRNNLCYQNAIDIEDHGSGSVIAENTSNGSNPSFTTCSTPSRWFPSGSPYCLASGSNARGIGHVQTGVTVDIVGTNRGTIGAVTDAGAYLFSAGGPAVTAQTIRWKFDESSGTTTADSSGNGFTGTLVSAPPRSPGRQGPKSLTFNGTSQYVNNATYAWPSNQAVTVMFWINTPGGQEAGAFGMVTGNDAVRFGAHVPWNDNNLYWDYGEWATTGRISVDFTTYLNKWTHVALVASGTGNLKAIYLNGQLVNSSGSSGTPSQTLTGLEVGRWTAGATTTYYQPGLIDDFRIETRAWSAAEILADYRRASRAKRHGAIAGQ